MIYQKKVIDELKNREDEEGTQLYFEENEKFNEILLHEELYWKQHVKSFWLAEGDTNSKFFHAAASSRIKTNHIVALKSEDGRLVSDHRELCRMLKEYYNNVFSGVEGDAVFTENEGGECITRTQNEMLVANLTFEEFTEAVKSMHPDKASGPNGLNPVFFQHFWNLLGKEVFLCF